MAVESANYNKLSSRRNKLQKIRSTRRDNQSNVKEVSSISTGMNYINPDNEGYLSANFTADESYRKGIKQLDESSEKIFARQIEEKPESYASIRLVQQARVNSSKSFKQFEQETNIIPPYTRFFLQSVSHANQEKYQIVQTFGNFKVFFFDKQPVIKNYSGFLLNTKNHDWRTDFEYVYDQYLRGTRSVELNAKTYLTFDNVIVEGYILNAQFNQTAMEQNGTSFSFSMLVTNKTPINLSEVTKRNRVTEKFRNKSQVLDNQKKLPSSALEKMRAFFNNENLITVGD